MNWNPPEVPTPGIAGGGKANARPSVRPASCLLMFALMAVYVYSGFVRSLHGLNVTKKNAL
jgi:hypothetical protein